MANRHEQAARRPAVESKARSTESGGTPPPPPENPGAQKGHEERLLHLARMREKFEKKGRDPANERITSASLVAHEEEINEAAQDAKGKKNKNQVVLRTPKEKERMRSVRFKMAADEYRKQVEDIEKMLSDNIDPAKSVSANRAYYDMANSTLQNAKKTFDNRLGWERGRLDQFKGHNERTMFAGMFEEAQHVLSWAQEKEKSYPWKPITEAEKKQMETPTGKRLVETVREARTFIDTAVRINKKQREKEAESGELMGSLFPESSIMKLKRGIDQALTIPFQSYAAEPGKGGRRKNAKAIEKAHRKEERRYQDAVRKQIEHAIEDFRSDNRKTMGKLDATVWFERPSRPLERGSVPALERAVAIAAQFAAGGSNERADFMTQTHELERALDACLEANPSSRRHLALHGPRVEAKAQRDRDAKQRYKDERRRRRVRTTAGAPSKMFQMSRAFPKPTDDPRKALLAFGAVGALSAAFPGSIYDESAALRDRMGLKQGERIRIDSHPGSQQGEAIRPIAPIDTSTLPEQLKNLFTDRPYWEVPTAVHGYENRKGAKAHLFEPAVVLQQLLVERGVGKNAADSISRAYGRKLAEGKEVVSEWLDKKVLKDEIAPKTTVVDALAQHTDWEQFTMLDASDRKLLQRIGKAIDPLVLHAATLADANLNVDTERFLLEHGGEAMLVPLLAHGQKDSLARIDRKLLAPKALGLLKLPGSGSLLEPRVRTSLPETSNDIRTRTGAEAIAFLELANQLEQYLRNTNAEDKANIDRALTIAEVSRDNFGTQSIEYRNAQLRLLELLPTTKGDVLKRNLRALYDLSFVIELAPPSASQ